MEAVILPDVAVREPHSGETWFCVDWACRSWMECEHHFGRSLEYASMADPMKRAASLLVPDRAGYSAACDHFRRDKPREWNQNLCKPGAGECPGCCVPECPRAPSNVISIASRRVQ